MKNKNRRASRLLSHGPILSAAAVIAVIAGLGSAAWAQKQSSVSKQSPVTQPVPNLRSGQAMLPGLPFPQGTPARETAEIVASTEKAVVETLDAHKGALLAVAGDTWNRTPAIERVVIDRIEALKPDDSMRIIIFNMGAFRDVTFRGKDHLSRREIVRSLIWETAPQLHNPLTGRNAPYFGEWMTDSLIGIMKGEVPREGVLLWLGNPNAVSVAKVQEALAGRTCPIHIIAAASNDPSSEGALRRLASLTHGSFAFARSDAALRNGEEQTRYTAERLLIRAEDGWIEAPAPWLTAVPDVLFPVTLAGFRTYESPDFLLEVTLSTETSDTTNAVLKNTPEELKAFHQESVEQLLNTVFLSHVDPERAEALKAKGSELVSRVRIIMPPVEK